MHLCGLWPNGEHKEESTVSADLTCRWSMQGDHHHSGQQTKNGRSGRSAPGPGTQAGFTLEDHLRDSMQSPAVRIVGALVRPLNALHQLAAILCNLESSG
jgi:hypothetical protein